MKEALKALDRLCNMASGQAGQDFSCAKVDYWTVKDAINNKWQSIETAPHDKDVLLCWKDNSGNWQFDCGYATTGWKLAGVSTLSQHGFATHWMPLPPPPGEGE